MCTVSHCHKILPGFYRYKRCEQHRLQNRYHSKLKRVREKVVKSVGPMGEEDYMDVDSVGGEDGSETGEGKETKPKKKRMKKEIKDSEEGRGDASTIYEPIDVGDDESGIGDRDEKEKEDKVNPFTYHFSLVLLTHRPSPENVITSALQTSVIICLGLM